jgi:dihydropyrimidine dehydrogenase (NAD+) subunit PreT
VPTSGSPLNSPSKRRVRLSGIIWPALGAGAVQIAVITAWFGWSYYRLPHTERPWDPLHELLSPGGAWGHLLGIMGSVFMISNLLYLVRRRWSRLRFFGPVSAWLAFHVAAGIGGVALVLVHSAGKFNNPIARVSAIAAVVVLITGVLGRWIYGQVAHNADGEAAAEAELVGRMRALISSVGDDLRGAAEDAERSLAAVLPPPSSSALQATAVLPLLPWYRFKLNRAQRRLRRELAANHPRDIARRIYVAARDAAIYRKNARRQEGFKLLVGAWRGVHRVSTFVLVLTLIAHVVIILFVGGI